MCLWEFLLGLLSDEKFMHLISWTNYDGEFRFHQPEEVAKLWGLTKNKNDMTYAKLTRGLRNYYDKVILNFDSKLVKDITSSIVFRILSKRSTEEKFINL